MGTMSRGDDATNPSASDDLGRGKWVKVIAGEDEHFGQVGKVVEVLGDDDPDGFDVCVQFRGDTEHYAFARSELLAAKSPRLRKRLPAKAAPSLGRRTRDVPLTRTAGDRGQRSPTSRQGGDLGKSTGVPRIVWISGAGILLLIFTTVMVFVSNTGNQTLSKQQTTGDSASSSTPFDGNLLGALDDWWGAVCSPGTWQNGGKKVFPNESESGFCIAGQTPIWVARFASTAVMRNDLIRMNMQSFAWGHDGPTVVVFATNQNNPSPLGPLSAYGFRSGAA